jgi:hypothetical protein
MAARMMPSRDVHQIPSQLIAYPGFGLQTESGNWKLRISGVAFLTPDEFNIRKRMMIRMLRNAMQVPAQALDNDMFRRRVTPFLVDAEHRQKIFVTIAGERFRLKKKTSRDGKFQSWLELPDSVARDVEQTSNSGNRLIHYTVSTGHPQSVPVQGSVFLLDRTGTSVVSDIDDTIKVTSVVNRRELLANTFLRDFASVDGMPEVYRQWSEAGFDFHYVSSSPWQLYHALLEMQVDAGFPSGTIHLRNFRFRDQLLKKVLIIRRKGKISAIRSLLKHLPERNFIFVGDSGEKDPEIYRKLGKKYPAQVKGVFIRELPGRPLLTERWAKVQEPLRRGICHKFATAEELNELSAPIVAKLGTRQLV